MSMSKEMSQYITGTNEMFSPVHDKTGLIRLTDIQQMVFSPFLQEVPILDTLE